MTWKRSNRPGASPMPESYYLHDPAEFTPLARKPAPEHADRRSLPGAQEAESLKILDAAPNSTAVLPIFARDKGFLLWGKTKLGDRLVLEFDAPEAGERTLILALGRAKNSGTVKIMVNGKVLTERSDLYHPISHFLEHEYKRVPIRKGANELEFKMVASNPAAQPWSAGDGVMKLSLDYLRFR